MYSYICIFTYTYTYIYIYSVYSYSEIIIFAKICMQNVYIYICILFVFTLYSSSFKSRQILQTSAEYTTDLMPNAWMICAHSKPWGPNNTGKLEARNPLVSWLIQLVTNRSLLRLHELAKENFKTSFIGTNNNTTLFGNGNFFFQ